MNSECKYMKKPLTKQCKWLILKLSDQGSNLDSSDPESDVLPITPSDNFHLRSAKLYNFLNATSEIYSFFKTVLILSRYP